MEENKQKILIVDDNPKNIELAANILRLENYNVSYARSGKAALVKTSLIDFDLVLLDIMMPEMDGYEVCMALKENPKTSEIPIIFLTAKSEIKNVLHGFELGAVDYITKPFSPEILLARVKNHLEIKRKLEIKKEVNQKSQPTKLQQPAISEPIENDYLREIDSENSNDNLKVFYDLRIQFDKWLQDKSPQAKLEIRRIKEMISHMFLDEKSKVFHNALKKKYKELGNEDLRLCTFLKLRLLNIEISEFLEISPDALYTRKSRLRRKLNLSKNQDISDFLINFEQSL